MFNLEYKYIITLLLDINKNDHQVTEKSDINL